MDIDARAFGHLEAEVKGLREMLKAQNETMADLTEQLAKISTTLSEAKGGWRVLLGVAGVSASLATAIQWAIQHFKA